MNPELQTSSTLGLPHSASGVGQGGFSAPSANGGPAPAQTIPTPQFNVAAPAESAASSPAAAPPMVSGQLPITQAGDVQSHDISVDDASGEGAIDQEWVAKAQEIVQHTRTDPYLQSQELGKIKAQYIKIRYNKDVKTNEEN